MTNNQYEEIIKSTCDILDANLPTWRKRYDRYANKIIKNQDSYNNHRQMFQVCKPLYRYSSIGKIEKGRNTSVFDIRYAGQSVASVIVDPSLEPPVCLKISDAQDKSNEKYFHFKNSKQYNGDWKKAREFRAFFKNLSSTKNSGSKSEEHRIESFLLSEFNKKTRKDGKKLCNIQPIKLGDLFFQLTTPLSASTHIPTYSNNGGGIDILARVRHIDNSVRIAVIELKDENKSSEPQSEVMKQALIYATFISYLLRCEYCELWWKIFGFSKPEKYINKTISIDVVTLMPKKEVGNVNEEVLIPINVPTLKNVILYPQTLYYTKDSNGNPIEFTGSLKDELMK